ncbi:GNAT family N-acetyltransferase [Cellulomonas carbonis]|uniref:GCN5 family acetyltransferase n=1 Tax=Cellulomonas carbonis T26 TaxID=947969 RepID=A0A0A0BU65_9CELL|nr:GNAT family N-acetyltransferase [Cellulomonas carbonis]KGM11953.1 GCN5 family acetyltransferase [Cellulomonas carbonis T26]GGB95411.1 hypothetical protein GCM10010972_05170 [Cellulomonas carbonis]
MRPGVEVRPAEPADVDGVVALALAARAETALGPQLCSPDPATVAHQIGALTAAPGGLVLVACAGEEVVGLVLGRVVGPNVFTDEVNLVVEALYVSPRHRRRGTGHALMTGAAEHASQAGAEHVYVMPLPGARGMQRFFVQLGFAPAAMHRVATTASLQRRLAQEAAGARRPARSVEDLIARRRQSRRLEPDPAVDRAALRPAVEASAQPRSSITRHVRRAVQTRLDLESTTAIS